MWQGIRIGLQLITMMLFAWGLGGCLTTFSIGAAARPPESYRTRETLDENLAPDIDIPTPQLFNFGFDLPHPELNEP